MDTPPSQARSLELGSWVGERRLYQLFLFLTASRMVLPKILVLTAPTPRSQREAARGAGRLLVLRSPMMLNTGGP